MNRMCESELRTQETCGRRRNLDVGTMDSIFAQPFFSYRRVSQVVDRAVEEGVVPLLDDDVGLAAAEVGTVVDAAAIAAAAGLLRLLA